jgi:small subunit ribosomal protein S20
MPVTKTAKRAQRVSKKKTSHNKERISELEMARRSAEKNPSLKSISKVVSLIDRAVKLNLMHKNKAARLKGALDKLIPQKTSKPKARVKKTKK